MKAKVIKTGEIVEVVDYDDSKAIVYRNDETEFFAQNEYKRDELESLPDTHEQVTIDGWVTRSKNGKIVFSDSSECKRGSCVWYHKEGSNIVTLSDTGLFNEDILPSITWESEPKRVRITLTPMEE